MYLLTNVYRVVQSHNIECWYIIYAILLMSLNIRRQLTIKRKIHTDNNVVINVEINY